MFRRGRFFQGAIIPGTDVKDVTWLRADGVEMTEGDWANAQAKMLCLLLSGEAGLMHLTARGDKETDDTFLLIVNASHEDGGAEAARGPAGRRWETLIDTAREDGDEDGERFAPGEEVGLIARSAKLLIRRSDE